MDAKKFLKEIRSIVREEIEYALERRLTEKKQKPVSETINHGMNLYKQVSKKPSSKKPSSNGKMSSIQDLLNETRMSMEAAMNEGYEEYPEMRFDSNSLNAFASPRGGHIDATPDGVNHSEVAPEVHQALTRDYSALMAKINEKKGR
jgi:hypothetical protein